MKRFASYHLPAILYGVLIIVLSSISYLKIPRVKVLEFDKVIHFVEYAIFAGLVFRSFSHISTRIRGRLVLLLSFLFMAGFALLDESYQKFIPGRDPDLVDFIFDLSGSLAILLYLWWRQTKRRGA